MSLSSRRVLLLGGTGFIGRPLARRLTAAGESVTTASRSHLADVHIDATSPESVVKLLSVDDYDVVVNLLGAGLATATVDPLTLAAVNADLPALALRALQERDSGTQFIHAASSTERTSQDPVDESEYSRTKHEGAEALRALAAEAMAPVTLLRMHNTYGPGQPSTRFIAATIERLASGQALRLNFPDRVRDFVFLDDMVDSVIRVIDSPTPGLSETELGTGIGTTLRDAAVTVARLLGQPTELVESYASAADDPHPYAVADVIGGDLGTCRTSLADGLARTIGET